MHKKIIISFLVLLALIASTSFVLAGEKEAIDSAVKAIDAGFKGEIITAEDKDPSETAQGFIGNAIKIILGIMGSIALCVFIYGGIIWMTSGGADQRISTAQNTMIWAALGLFVIFSSYMIITYLIDKFAF